MHAYQLTLLELFEERKLRNQAYSLRAFARSCGISAASLSQILSGKRRLTPKFAARISERLAFAPDAKAQFVRATSSAKAALGPREELSVERFRMIADWYHFGILCLAELPGHRAHPAWISQRLGITASEAKAALKRLQDLGYLKVEGGKLKPLLPPLVSTNDIASAALRKYNRQILERALNAQESVAVEWRDIGAITMALDPQHLPEAKRLIRSFRQQIAALCEKGKPALVYHFSTQLFPVSVPENFCDPKEYEDAIRMDQ